jgi:hypothetical protein
MVVFVPLSLRADPSGEAQMRHQIQDLQQQVNALKAQMPAAQAASQGGLKTEDLQGKTVDSRQPSSQSAAGANTPSESIPPEVLKQLQDQMVKMQKNQAETTKFLQEMDKELK